MHPLLADNDEPRIFFQVMVVYEDCEATSAIPLDSRQLESEAIGDLPRASKVAKHTIQAIQTKFPGSELVDIGLEQARDGYHLSIRDDTGKGLAKVGIVAIDYSDETLH